MQLTLRNLTSQSVTCLTGKHVLDQSDESTSLSDGIVLLGGTSTTITLPKRYFNIRLFAGNPSRKSQEKDPFPNRGIPIRISRALGASSWGAIPIPDDCCWRVYCSRITRKHHLLLIFPRRDLSAFLSEIPDSVPLSSLSLPGTHDTMAFYGWPISQCQSISTPLAIQLESGIRVLDIRLAVINSRLIAYHGLYPQRTPFQTILSTIHAFLTAPASSRETIVMSVKQEDFSITSPKTFSRLVHEEIFSGPGGAEMWFFGNRVPDLGEVRGKVVMFSRFGGDGAGWEGGLEGLGMHPTTWPDSEKYGFSWQCKNTLVITHDWYSIPTFLSIPEKVELSTRILLPPPNDPPMPTLAITFFSASSFPLASPPTVALGFGWPQWNLGVEGVNARVGRWLLRTLGGDAPPGLRGEKREHNAPREPRVRGWALMDFYADPGNAGVVPLLVECNFRGRVEGEEGWQR